MLDSRKREIRVRAENFRNNCKVSRYGIIDLFEECSRKNFKLVRYPLGENADMGFALKRDGDIVIFTTHQAFRYIGYFDVLIIDEVDAFPYKDNEQLKKIVKKCIFL